MSATTIYDDKLKAYGTYRMPVLDGEMFSRRLTMTWDGDLCHMYGGRWGSHDVHTSDIKAVRAHWYGYVSNNRGRQTRPELRLLADGREVA